MIGGLRPRVRISHSPLRTGAIRVFRITNPAESIFCGICYFCRSQAATMTAIARCRFPTPQTAARTAFRLQYACKQVFRQSNRLELRKIYPKFDGRCIRSRHPVRSLDGTELQTPDDLEFGFAHSVNKEDWMLHRNPRTGRICIGNPAMSGNGVEFIQNCVAIINESHELAALWLKPHFI